MWVAEGLTHRYPTKVLAELLPTCPQYCGHCTRMDLVGNSTPVIQKLKFAEPVAGLADELELLDHRCGVADQVHPRAVAAVLRAGRRAPPAPWSG